MPDPIAGAEPPERGRAEGLDGRARASLLGVDFDLWTEDQLRRWVRSVLEGPPENRHIAFSNSEFVLEARRNGRLRRYLNACDHNFVDGIGVVLGLWLATGIRRPQRLSGTVFVATMCEEAAASGARVFLFGSRPGVAIRAAAGLERRAPGLQVCGTADGFGDAAGVLELVRASAPDVLVVCLGNPAQERWVEDHMDELRVKLVWGAGGALDFYSGDVPLAPQWVQRAGLEWLFRLVTNFSIARLRRQLRLVEFIGLVVRERVRRGRRSRRGGG
jgi:N-acetylglucosaminyldiphosphoundecaprenol N-acetyl-beta-D-mannosaminyltransferase